MGEKAGTWKGKGRREEIGWVGGKENVTGNKS